LAVSLGAACVRAVEPIAHGVWLVAYLFLVGFLAQLLLDRGRQALRSPGEQPPRRVHLPTVLWNAGVVLVPLGVLADVRLPIVLGSIALLGALGHYWQPAGTAAETRELRLAVVSQSALTLFMAASVLVGVLLGWDRPWL
jgi:hypothetical protein